MKILVLSKDNSIHSPMAESILNNFDPDLDVHSAGLEPAKKIHPRTIQVLDEIGIKLKPRKPEHVQKYLKEDFDYLITIFKDSKETIPTFKGTIKNRIHLEFDDPVDIVGSDEEVISAFRKLRDLLKTDLQNFYYEIVRAKKNQ